jgi:hypothetical protein
MQEESAARPGTWGREKISFAAVAGEVWMDKGGGTVAWVCDEEEGGWEVIALVSAIP